MKMYISGQITGIDDAVVEQRFNDAEEFLSGLDLEVVNPLKNGLDKKSPWIKHLCKDIELLDGCDAIYMMDNWGESDGACIEYDFAVRRKKDIWFESNIVRNQSIVLRIQNAVHEVTGLNFNQYTTKSRKRDGFFARMLFVYHCRRNKMKLVEIAKYVHRDHTSMLHLLKKYEDETRFNPYFKAMADKVNNILNKTSNALGVKESTKDS